LFLAFSSAIRAQPVPVFVIPPEESSIKFHVNASVALDGTFDKWNATFTVTSTDALTGVLDIKIQAESVHTGSGMKDGKLKGRDFFDVKQDPYITFHSNKIVQTGPDTFDVQGTFTIREVSKPALSTISTKLVQVAGGLPALGPSSARLSTKLPFKPHNSTRPPQAPAASS